MGVIFLMDLIRYTFANFGIEQRPSGRGNFAPLRENRCG